MLYREVLQGTKEAAILASAWVRQVPKGTSGFTLSINARGTGRMGERDYPRWHDQSEGWGVSQSPLKLGFFLSLASILTPDQRASPTPPTIDKMGTDWPKS